MAFGDRVARIAANRQSGATDVAAEVARVLSDALRQGKDVRELGRDLVRAQPTMAPVWNLVGSALASRGDAASFTRALMHLSRASRVLIRHGAALLLSEVGSDPLRIVTISFSGTVLATLQAVAAARAVHVSCADGYPALEGRKMAQRLADSGMPVTHYSDAALGQALDGAHAVLVGADALSPDWFLNKSGTHMLAAAAAQQGVPVYVAATRDKFVSRAIAARLTIRDEQPAEIWSSPPAGVVVRNRYFEPTPLDLVAAVISDLGVLGAALVADACVSPHEAWLLDL